MSKLNSQIFLLRIIFVTTFFLSSLNAMAQISQKKIIDLKSGLNEGTIQATVYPLFTKNNIDKIFDGNPYTEAVVEGSDSVTISLHFDTPVKISRSKIFLWNNGTWKLEAANSIADLNARSGTYQLLVANSKCTFFAWDSLDFKSSETEFIRLTAKNSQDKNVYLGEWVLYTGFTVIALQILPDPPRLVVGTSLQLEVKMIGDDDEVHPFNLKEQLFWNTENPLVADVDELGVISGFSLGNATIRATVTTISDTVVARVEHDFQSTNADRLTIKVALVLQDPIIDKINKRKIHQVRNWENPMNYIIQLLEDFNQISDGVIQFQIVETHDDKAIFTRLDDTFMTIDTLAYYFNSISNLYGRDKEGTLQNLAEKQDRVHFDYLAMIDYYNFAAKRNKGEIHEIWVYAYPFAGMYESQLVGPNAFWYNSPPLAHPGLQKLLSIMGWNYERGVAEALESFGHRSESALVHVHGDRWDVHSPHPTDWEIFTRIDKDFPGEAQVGNIHFPPNGMSDYDYSNRRYVKTYADNWKRYPILLNQSRTINCEEWGSSHREHLKWWYNHLPRYTGVTHGVLNNWWHYIVDYESAVALALQLTTEIENDGFLNRTADAYILEQNYPNPFNPLTTIKFSLPNSQQVTLKVFDLLGREVKIICDEKIAAGSHEFNFDGTELSSGLYFYKLTAGRFHQSRKFILLK